jgi:hypothetical protein
MKYNVHVFAVVRVKVAGVEADSQTEAIEKARACVDWYGTFENISVRGKHVPGVHIDATEFAEEFSHYLVDEQDDPEYNNSQWFDSAPALVAKHARLRD